MSVDKRSFATSSGMDNQETGEQTIETSSGPNNSDEQVEPASTLSIFALSHKK